MNFILSLLFTSFVVQNAIARVERRCQNTEFQCDNGQCLHKYYWCNSDNYNYCSDRSNTINCGKIFPDCSSDQLHCLNKTCIPKLWVCDGYKDCSDGLDEKDCQYDLVQIEGLLESRNKAKLWLLKQRRADWGWGKDTHRVIVALYLSNLEQFSPGRSQNDIMVKELQLQISELLLKKNSNSIPNYDIAFYIHSLLATCLNPMKFQGYDLVEELINRMNNSDVINPFLPLAICNANGNITESYIENLIRILKNSNVPLWTNSQAITIMLLLCLRQRMTTRTENFDLFASKIIPEFLTKRHIDSVVKQLIILQGRNGNFGNVHTTALIMQTLMASDNYGDNWNMDKAFQYIISKQKSDGSFGDILTTYLVLPILYGRSLVDLGNVSCESTTIETRNMTVKEELDNRIGNRHHVNYKIWVGFQRDISFSISVNVPGGTTFYDVMCLAAELNDKYKFKYVQYDWGKYIYLIFNVNNDPETGKYWELYHIKQDEALFVNQSPDILFTKSNDTFVYWYKSSHLLMKD